MRQSREAKSETRAAIVDQASRLFRERGIDGTSVGDVMHAAAKTHGGFYRHFDTKDALLETALGQAFADMVSVVEREFGSDAPAGADPTRIFNRYYLDDARVADRGGWCPAAAMAGDTARSGDTIKTVFGKGLRAMIDAIADRLPGSPEDRQQAAIRIFTAAAGTLMLARASDAGTAAMLLDAARKSAAD